MRYEELVYWNNKSYGKVTKFKTKYVGFVLDLIIPFTFGLITLGLIKLYGKELRIWKELMKCLQMKNSRSWK